MAMAFYQDSRTYMLDELGQGLNTFGKHISRLKTFLTWVEQERELPVHRRYRKFTVPNQRGLAARARQPTRARGQKIASFIHCILPPGPV